MRQFPAPGRPSSLFLCSMYLRNKLEYPHWYRGFKATFLYLPAWEDVQGRGGEQVQQYLFHTQEIRYVIPEY